MPYEMTAISFIMFPFHRISRQVGTGITEEMKNSTA